MSRLADRILSSCLPVKLNDIRPDVDEGKINSEITEALKLDRPNASEREIDRLLLLAKERYRNHQPRAIETMDYDELFNGVPIIQADDVALYFSTLPIGTKVEDIVAGMAPPFDYFFIEFQGVPNPLNLNAWGVLFESYEIQDYWGPEEIKKSFEVDGDVPRWMLVLGTFIENRKGEPVGPIAFHYAGLADDGTWFRHADGSVAWDGKIPELTENPPEDAMKDWVHIAGSLNLPALLALSFMHCKNSSLKTTYPNKKLSKKYRKRFSRELVRYHTLEIDPIRKLIDRYRNGSQGELKRALHICRGHFKTFSEEAKLFGRHTGTYWWAPQIRGEKSVGVVVKDYRVLGKNELGKPYIKAEEAFDPNLIKSSTSRNPDKAGRGLVAHNKTQNLIAKTVGELGWQPRSPARDEPEFDLAWNANELFFVCEVKSITKENEERQLRMALGQVIRYKQKLVARGHEPVYPVVAAEIKPEDTSWLEVFEEEGIAFVWPENHRDKLIWVVEKHSETFEES